MHIQLNEFVNLKNWTIMLPPCPPTSCIPVSLYHNHGCMDRKVTKKIKYYCLMVALLFKNGLIFLKNIWKHLNSVALPVSSIIWRRIDTFATPSLPVHKETRLFEAEVKLLRFKWPHFWDPVLFCTGGDA